MDLKWLEDFVSLARTQNFSRSAEERHVTQSAFSRRIQSLERWLGASLINRSVYPTTLTDDGRKFLETAEEAVRLLHASRLDLQARPDRRTVSIAALHTLSLRFFPNWLRRVEEVAGPVASRLLPDDFHACLQALVEGGYDFLLTFSHPHVPILLDPDLYPHVIIGADGLLAAASPTALEDEGDGPLPLLAYAPDSFLGRAATFAQAQPGARPVRPHHTNENAMAESLRFMALEGHGLAWLPRSLIADDLHAGRLVATGAEVAMQVRLYRNAGRRRAAVEAVWRAAQTLDGSYSETE